MRLEIKTKKTRLNDYVFKTIYYGMELKARKLEKKLKKRKKKTENKLKQ